MIGIRFGKNAFFLHFSIGMIISWITAKTHWDILVFGLGKNVGTVKKAPNDVISVFLATQKNISPRTVKINK